MGNFILIYIVVIGAVFMFMTTRGRKRQAAQAQSMQQALGPGAEVRTIGGLVGTVVEMTDEYVTVETTPGVKLKFTRQAISGVIPPEPEAETPGYGTDLTAAEEDAAEAEAESDAEEAAAEPEDAKDEQKVG